MARTDTNVLLHGLGGQLGRQIVVKTYGTKTVVTKYPDMSQVKPSKLQKKQRSRFADAVAYARAINNNPAKRATYQKKVKRGGSVFQYALKEYLNRKA
jgi:nitrate reductase alpha subunit